MKLIIRADDLGISDGINCGIRKAVKDGLVTSVGMMPNMPEAQNGYDMIREFSICLGQHTNICLGKPINDPKRIPSLIQENGEFCTSAEIRARKQDTIILEEAEIEIEAQYQRFKEITGKDPDYFEGHAVASPNYFQAIQNVAKRHDLFYSNPVDPQWIRQYGIECAAFYHLNEQNVYDIDRYILEDEANILSKNCAVLVFHPGYLDQYVLDHSSFTRIRTLETEFLCSQRFKDYIKNNQIKLVDFKNYKEKENGK